MFGIFGWLKELVKKVTPKDAGWCLKLLVGGIFLLLLCLGISMILHGRIEIKTSNEENSAAADKAEEARRTIEEKAVE